MVMARKLFAALFIAASLTPSNALAGREDPTWNPPPEFDYPFPGKMEVRYLPQHLVVKECHRIGPRLRHLFDLRGCSRPVSKSYCLVIVSSETYKRATPSAILRHERGHCNGWRHPVSERPIR